MGYGSLTFPHSSLGEVKVRECSQGFLMKVCLVKKILNMKNGNDERSGSVTEYPYWLQNRKSVCPTRQDVPFKTIFLFLHLYFISYLQIIFCSKHFLLADECWQASVTSFLQMKSAPHVDDLSPHRSSLFVVSVHWMWRRPWKVQTLGIFWEMKISAVSISPAFSIIKQID